MASHLQPSWQAKEAEITAVIGVKNKCWRHVRHCIESLGAQTIPFRLIVVDYGSDRRHLSQIRRLTSADWIRLIEVMRDTEPWREGRALNIGIKRAETPYILTTNADLIFAPNFVEVVLGKLVENPKRLVICDRIDLDIRGEEIGKAPPHYYGTCLGTTLEWWVKVRGFDERYKVWGRVDHDLHNRAKTDGLEIVNADKTSAWHQYHKHLDSDNRLEVEEYNREIFYESTSIIRNKEGWGEL